MSIQKWQDIVDGVGVDDGAKNCALCEMFSENLPVIKICVGCPVWKKTGERCCADTPYDDWMEIQEAREKRDRDYDSLWECFDEKSKEAAKKELEFLKSLLPEKSNGTL